MATKTAGKSAKKTSKQSAAQEAPELKVTHGALELGKVQGFGLSTKGQKKGNAIFSTVPANKVKVEKGFNPRTNLGDVSALVSSIKKDGLVNPITVRPVAGQEGSYNIIAGHRRYEACKQAGITDIPVMIRTDLNDDSEAKAVSVAENSDDARTSLNYVEMGAVFNELEKKYKWSKGVIASKCGVHEQTVRRAVTIFSAPDDVQKRVSAGTMSVGAALEYTKLDSKSRKAIEDQLEEGISAKKVRELGKKAAKESATKTDAAGANKKKGADRDVSLTTWKGSRGKQDQIAYFCYLLESAKVEGENLDTDFDLLIVRGAILSLLWDRGDFESIFLPDAEDEENLPEGMSKAAAAKETKRFWSLVKAEAKKYTPPPEEEEAAEEPAEEAAAE